MKTVIINDLEWQYEDDGVTRKWNEAVEYAKSLGKDWRLPTIQELISIVDYAQYNPACNSKLKCRSSGYWSGTTVAYYPNHAWYVGFHYGYDLWDNKDGSYYVRCVRSIGEKNV